MKRDHTWGMSRGRQTHNLKCHAVGFTLSPALLALWENKHTSTNERTVHPTMGGNIKVNLNSSMKSKKTEEKWKKQIARENTTVFRDASPSMAAIIDSKLSCWRWGGWHPWSKESRQADGQSSDSRPVVGGAVAAVVLVGEERALDKDTWLGLETLVTSCVWLVVDDWRLRAPAPWKEVPLLKVLTTSICWRKVGQERTNGCSEWHRLNGNTSDWIKGIQWCSQTRWAATGKGVPSQLFHWKRLFLSGQNQIYIYT